MSDRSPALWQPRQYGEWDRTKQSCSPHPGSLRPPPLRRQPLSGMDAKGGKREVEQRARWWLPDKLLPAKHMGSESAGNRAFGHNSAPDLGSTATERPFRRISTNRRQGRFATPIQYRRNVCSSCRHTSLKSRSGSTCLPIQSSRISSIVMFGARYASTMMRHTVSAASTTRGYDTRRIRFVSA